MKAMICVVLDRSGSMAGRENDVVGGVNNFLAEQKKLPDPASITFVRFDTQATERFRTMGPLAECADMTRGEFEPRGGTPLLDAVGSSIATLDEDWKREQPERCIVVVVTDGEENSSREYTKAKVKEMIETRQASGKWAFIYLGANVDAFSEGGSMGFSAANTAGYQNTAMGTKAMYAAASLSVGAMRSTGATLSTNLGGDIAEDGNLLNKAVPAPAPSAKAAWTAPVSTAPWSPPA